MSFALEVELLLVEVIGRNHRHKKRSLSVTTWLRPANLVRLSRVRESSSASTGASAHPLHRRKNPSGSNSFRRLFPELAAAAKPLQELRSRG